MTNTRLALIEPYVSDDSLKSYADKTEPSHLLGMYNRLQRLGCDVVLLDAYSRRYSVADTIAWITKQEVTHLGITVYDYFPCLTYVEQLFNHLPRTIGTIVGGPGPTYCADRMIRVLKPNWLVQGPGEQAIIDLFEVDFSTEDISDGVVVEHTTVVRSRSTPLDQIPFERPYDLSEYDYQASPRIQTGCIGKCVFCSGAYQKNFDYITTATASRLLDYLVNSKGTEVIAPNGPDFTAVPQKANAFVHLLVENAFKFTSFRPGLRLDTLLRSISLDPSIWKRLSINYQTSFESSIESFSASRLNRLGKNLPFDFLKDVYSNMATILNVCDCKIVLGRIALDPMITIDEFIEDCIGYRKLLRQFPNELTIGGMLMNEFVPLHGTPATEMASEECRWSQGELLDPAMRRLQEDLFENDQFKQWCLLAEQIEEFGERNLVFEEILRVSESRAMEAKSAC